jgi:5-methylcytosine-specific restriction enzyme subunit McrC
MYQLYAYGKKYKKCKELYLIYPKDDDVKSKRYKYEDELYLSVVFFDVKNDLFTCEI